jgi:hypothetical protein
MEDETMTTTAGFKPFEVDRSVEQLVGTILNVNAINATIPESILPRRVRIKSSWRKRLGATWMQFFLDHDGGLISFPDAPGDGEPSLRQAIGWLERHGYREISDPIDGIFLWERAGI